MNEKKCSKCQEVKPVSEFHKDRTRKDGLHDWCKACRAEYQKTEKVKEGQKRRSYKYLHSETGRETHKRYRITHKVERKLWRQKQIRYWRYWFRKYGFVFPEDITANYHHRDPASKLFGIGEAIRSGLAFIPENLKLMREEIQKCEVKTRSEHQALHRRLQLTA